MAIDPNECLITAANAGLSIGQLKRMGMQLYPSANSSLWIRLTDTSQIPAHMLLAIKLFSKIKEYRFLTSSLAVAAVLFFEDRLKSYVKSFNSSSRDSVPVAVFEIMDSRWIRLGSGETLLDLSTLTEIDKNEFWNTNPLVTVSVGICLLPLVMSVLNVDRSATN